MKSDTEPSPQYALLRQRCSDYLLGEMTPQQAARFESELDSPTVAQALIRESELLCQLAQSQLAQSADPMSDAISPAARSLPSTAAAHRIKPLQRITIAIATLAATILVISLASTHLPGNQTERTATAFNLEPAPTNTSFEFELARTWVQPAVDWDTTRTDCKPNSAKQSATKPFLGWWSPSKPPSAKQSTTMVRPHSFLSKAGLLAVLCIVCSTSAGQVIGADDPAPSKAEKKISQRKFDQEQERGVLQMVHDHLPEIKVLLDQLREKEPRQYDAAIMNLAKSSRRLQAARKRGEAAFELEVQVVQAQSAINLLVAKLKVRDNQADRAALRDATQRLELAEFSRAKHDVAQMRSRLDKLQEQLQVAEKRLGDKQSQRDENIERAFQIYLRKSGRKE